MPEGHAFAMERGRPSIDAALCTGCGTCVDLCSSGSLALEDGIPVAGSGGVLPCLACGHCVAVCPAGAVRVEGRGMTPEDLLPLPPPSARPTAAALEALFLARRSIRRYLDVPVERSDIDRVLGMASTAPMGFPPSEVGVVVVQGRERVQELAEDLTAAFGKWLFLGTPAGSVLTRLMMDKASAEMMRSLVLPVTRLVIEARKEGRDLLFYDAPCVLLFHHPTKDPVDATIACTFATLAAESLGLGTCMIGTVAPALRGERRLRVKWGVPDKGVPALAMTLGHPAVRFSHAVRRRFASVRYA